jgi:hypothetical protein
MKKKSPLRAGFFVSFCCRLMRRTCGAAELSSLVASARLSNAKSFAFPFASLVYFSTIAAAA